VPDFVFNVYGVSTDWLARDRALLRDTIAAMIEANRAVYRDKEKVIPIMVEATQKPREAVEYAWERDTKNCIWGVNEGFNEMRTRWTIENNVEVGDIDAAHKPTVAQVFDLASQRKRWRPPAARSPSAIAPNSAEAAESPEGAT
jgi:hypothetical protein